MRRTLAALVVGLTTAWTAASAAPGAGKEIVYLSAKQDLPFWGALGRGVRAVVEAHGFAFRELDSRLDAKVQLSNARDAIAQGVVGIVISPTDSQAVPEVLDLARKAKVPVVIADIGTTGGEYLTYVKSDNYRGAYETGQALAAAMKERGLQEAPFAMVTISLARKNGQDRSNGFRDALRDAGITHEAPLRQMQDYSADETRRYVGEMLAATPKLRALFIETDQPVDGALQALHAAKRDGDVLIASFDAMPEVEELLTKGKLVAVGMQQPYLMGSRAAEALLAGLHGDKPPKQVLVPIMVATGRNIHELLPLANKTVFGVESR